MRREYRDRPLHRSALREHPMDQLADWLAEAVGAGIEDANAMSLATASCQGKPSIRMILAKAIDPLGVTFYTNFNSRKANEIAENPWASANFFWNTFERQFSIEGSVERLPRQTAEQYWNRRPRGSQLGAWASQQGRIIATREELEGRLAEMTARFDGHPVPMPEEWGGFRLVAVQVEVWQGRRDRLHDRFQYNKNNERWVIDRLSP